MSNTSLIQFEELPAITANAPAVLEKNTKRLQHVITKGQELLDTVEAEGMSPDLDAACNEYMAGVSKLKSVANELRSPITKMLTDVSKEFTSIENQMDKDNADSIPYRVQQARNEFARQQAAEARKKEQELRNKQLAQQERVDVIATVQLKVRERYNEALFATKNKFNDLFNCMTLETVSDVKKQLDEIPTSYPQDKFLLIACPVTAVYIPADEMPALIYDTKAGMYDELNANFTDEMNYLKHHLVDQIPARKQELEDIAKAGIEEAKRLREAAELRQREEQLRLDKQRQEKEANDLKAAELTKHIGTAQLSFEADVAKAEIQSQVTQAVKHSYVINVLSPVGWQKIAALWFSQFSSKLTEDKFEKKTLGAMKRDLEVLAFNGGERLADSAHLEYVEDVKALTKK